MTKPPNPQRRSRKSHDAILAAALELCGEEGYGRVTIEGIAARAGVSKKTIYRWWPSKGAVVLEALHEAADTTASHPDTGDLATDMRTQLAAVIDYLSPPSHAPLAGLIADALGDPELAERVRERLIRPRIEEFEQRMRRAQEQGQLHPDADLDVALDLFYGPLYHRLVFHLGPPEPEYLGTLIDHVIRALTPGGSGAT
ncbi:TetR/AcrR family transcriptional regulator [Streptomyces sp. JB150]|uniref:TetR/AcrR family transcriptional regulator n=1 Tax=Streptomyces sp. JB150 TaxID=2714844 RepID=UPI00140E1CEB|nr:TetR/AcrR family transcriptional regulator [Streptomyces sp. JB150]QIJ66296.1 TetR/AcrR family transcriptional regulator [Streptomyces sp. JB150]